MSVQSPEYQRLYDDIRLDILDLESLIKTLEENAERWEVSFQYVQRVKDALCKLKDEI